MASESLVVVVDGSQDSARYAERRLRELEARWSRFVPDSDVNRLNRCSGQELPVHRDTIALLRGAIDASRPTRGAFDPMLLSAVIAAGYRNSIDNQDASGDEAAGADARVGSASEIEIDDARARVRLPRGTAFDPGGIGKGMAADLVVAELLAFGVAGVLVDIGGDVRAAGVAPDPAGWCIAVEDPDAPTDDAELTRIVLADGGVATSGPRHRRLVAVDGTPGHHLIDPLTARPATAVPASVTVVAGTAALAEAFATAVAVGGETARDALVAAGLAALVVGDDRSVVRVGEFDRYER